MKDDQGRKLTAQALADRTAELGYPMDRSVIAKLEKGLRQTITVPDVLVLAQALEVSPLLLLLPLGEADSVEIRPGVEVATVDTLRWFLGERPLPGTRWEGLDTEDGSPTIASFQVHQQTVERFTGYRREALEGAKQGNDQVAEHFEKQAERAAEQLRSTRHLMRARGLTPPPLPADLAHIEGVREP